MTREYRDNQDFFRDVLALQSELAEQGKIDAANEIGVGVGSINGLTDGFAMFLDSLNKVRTEYSTNLDAVQKAKLHKFIKVAHKAVYRE